MANRFRGKMVKMRGSWKLSEFGMSLITVGGLIFAVASFIALYFKDNRWLPLILVLAGFSAMVLLAGLLPLLGRLRRFYVLTDVQPVVRQLCGLAERAQHRIWTVRTHFAEPEEEDVYFETIATRLRKHDNALKLCRIVCLSPAVGARQHLHWLINNLSDNISAAVYYYRDEGPSFDFAVFDSDEAVLGFPSRGPGGYSGAIFIRQRFAIRGVESAFEALREKSTLFFEGRKSCDEDQKQRLRSTIDNVLDGIRGKAS